MVDKPIILISGGFDPYHDGHARMFSAAALLGEIWVILNSDEWLEEKKGYSFMKWQERKGVLSTVRGVTRIWKSYSLCDVSGDIAQIVSANIGNFFFGKGGDRNADNTPESRTCEELNIPIIYGLGGNNEQSSSKIIKRLTNGWQS